VLPYQPASKHHWQAPGHPPYLCPLLRLSAVTQTNYEGTRQLLELAASFGGLKAFVHVSSAYTNMNATPGSLVQESIYPLTYGDQPVVDSALVQVRTALYANRLLGLLVTAGVVSAHRMRLPQPQWGC
jgi:nucleoside-diphosphate-sugar epimerase